MEVYPLGELIDADGGSEKGASNGRWYGNEGGKIEISTLGNSIGADDEAEIVSSNGIPDGNGYCNIESY